MFGLKRETLSLIISEISNYKEINEAVIFGSRAKGNYENITSDDLIDHIDRVGKIL